MNTKSPLIFILLCFVFPKFNAQNGWTWTQISDLPEPISNNAVCEAKVGNDHFVYSFSGIDTTKTHQGINLNSYKYNVQTDTWSTIASLPDTLGKIAAGASFVNGKIYIIGGYHVFQDGNELSSNLVHIYNPATDSYEPNGANIPVAIDDHVQCVYKDSLIFVVTGWSNTTNVPNVQIYDTYLNSWSVGTPTPNNNYYKAFGASGAIVGDTIIYNGGVRGGFNFAAVNFTRRGIIDPTDPTQISWELEEDNPGDPGYRAACSSYENRIFWIGGGGVAYNYNGLAYYGGAGVEPLTRIAQYHNYWDLWFEGLGTPYNVMDFRGIAKIGPNSWIIAGGMESGQQVSKKSYRIDFDPILGGILEESNEKSIHCFPNPAHDLIRFEDEYSQFEYEIFNLEGKLITSGLLNSNSINISDLEFGFYSLVLSKGTSSVRSRFIKSE